jgi:hypothetical protein
MKVTLASTQRKLTLGIFTAVRRKVRAVQNMHGLIPWKHIMCGTMLVSCLCYKSHWCDGGMACKLVRGVCVQGGGAKGLSE